MNRSCRLVARPERSTSRPVANGSSVPAWPVFAPGARTHAGDDGEGRRPRRLVDEDHAGRLERLRDGHQPAWLPFAAHERVDDPARDLVHREVGREPGGPLVAAAAEAARDRGHVDALRVRAQRALAGGVRAGRELADERDELGAVDGAQVVDDALRVRLLGPGVLEVRPAELRDDDPPVRELRRALERACEQLELRERRRLVDLDEHLRSRPRPPRRARRRAGAPWASCSSTGTAPCR